MGQYLLSSCAVSCIITCTFIAEVCNFMHARALERRKTCMACMRLNI